MPFAHSTKVSQAGYNNHKGSKIILIELTSLLLIIALSLFKALVHLWPVEWVLPTSLPELLLSMPSLLRTYPAFTGTLLSFLTWHLMYFDSSVPGVNPPTPLSPAKYREISGADFHLNFVFALLVGPLAAALLYLEWV